MINTILENLINTREVTSFINNVIVGTEKKEEHDKVVEEVVKRVAENNLYEKYKWKIREVEVLRIVIGLEEIKNRGGKDEGDIKLADFQMSEIFSVVLVVFHFFQSFMISLIFYNVVFLFPSLDLANGYNSHKCQNAWHMSHKCHSHSPTVIWLDRISLEEPSYC